MASVVLALGAVIAALLLALVLVLASMRRLRRSTDERVAAAVGDLNGRMETMVRELQGALERASEEGRRNRLLGELSARSTSTTCWRACSRRRWRRLGATRRMLLDRGVGRRAPPVAATLGLSSRRGRARDGRRPARRARGPLDRHHLPVHRGRARAGSGGDPRRRRGARLVDGRQPARDAVGLHPHAGARVPGAGSARAGGARESRRACARERSPLPRGAPARRPRRADEPAQPPLLPRDARPRGRPRPPLRPPARADRLRHRRLQVRQRPGRPSLGRRRARGGGGARALRRPLGRHRLPDRRRRVRGDHARSPRWSTPISSRSGCRPPSPRDRSARPGGSTLSAGVAELRQGDDRRACSSAPTRRSTAPRSPARAGVVAGRRPAG